MPRQALSSGQWSVAVCGDFPTNAIAPAARVVSTARDLALFFSQLSPNARASMLSVGGRGGRGRGEWRNEQWSLERYYGLGTMTCTSDFCLTSLDAIPWSTTVRSIPSSLL
jgi:hypothetical protein